MAQQPSNLDAEKKKFSLLFKENRAQREVGFNPKRDDKAYRETLKVVLNHFAKDPSEYFDSLESNLVANPTKQEIKIATNALRKAAKRRVPIKEKIEGDLEVKKNYFYPPKLGGPINDFRREMIREYFTKIPLTTQNVNTVNQLAYKAYLAGRPLGYNMFAPFTKEEISHTLDDMDFSSTILSNIKPTSKGWRCSAVHDGVKLPPILKSHFTPSNDKRMNPFMVKGSLTPNTPWEKKKEYFQKSRKYCREYKQEQNKRRRMK